MNCENTFCIYCDDDKCILEEININSLGRCDACIIINLSDELLRKEKEKLLDKYNF